MVMLKGGGWVLLMQKVWEVRFAPWGSSGDLITLVEGQGSKRLQYRGFWWRVAEGAHRIGVRLEGHVAAKQQGRG